MSMPSHTCVVRVASDLADLIPLFMESRHKELHALRAAIANADFEILRQIGHRMRGVGLSYGFEEVSAIGRRIEESARREDRAALEEHVSQYAAYLASVQVIYE